MILHFSLTLHAFLFFFFNDTATTEIYPLSLHDALPISPGYLLHRLFEELPHRTVPAGIHAGHSVGEQQRRIVGAGIAVHRDGVEAAVVDPTEQGLERRWLDHRISGDHREQGGHDLIDHAG